MSFVMPTLSREHMEFAGPVNATMISSTVTPSVGEDISRASAVSPTQVAMSQERGSERSL